MVRHSRLLARLGHIPNGGMPFVMVIWLTNFYNASRQQQWTYRGIRYLR